MFGLPFQPPNDPFAENLHCSPRGSFQGPVGLKDLYTTHADIIVIY